MQGKGYGPKTDVWALGCILYELCTLRKAFDAPNLGAITIRIMRCAFRSTTPLHHLLLRCLVALAQHAISRRERISSEEC